MSASRPDRSAESEPRRRAAKKRGRRRLGRWGCLALVGGLLLLSAAVYVAVLSREIGATFEGRLWSSPSRVLSAPLTIEVGEAISIGRIQQRLQHCRYTRVYGPARLPGQYRISGGMLEVDTREFVMAGDPWPARLLRITVGDGRVQSIESQTGRRRLRSAQIEPEVMASFYGANREDRTVLPLAGFPKTLVGAVLAAEDQRFLSHHGIDPLGVLRAVFENLRSGGVVQGGSTITQQTVKNLYLSNEKTFARKAKEAVMAVILDARYSKDRILEVYLNEIYLGQRGSVAVCGFAEASRFYFGKEVGDLDLAESAMLAGLIRAPAVYNPIAHPDRALARKDLVVQLMLEQGRISPEQARRAKETKPAVAKGDAGLRRAPFFVDEIRQELSSSHPARELTESGLKIITTLDPWMQEKAEEAVRRGLNRLEKERPALARHRQGLEGCLIAMDPRTGEVLALVGGRNYAESQFDRVTQARRQPGSLFKPFVYATGFERGRADTGEPFTPATILEDEPLSLILAGKEWNPHNYDGEYRGTVTAREALENSLNVPTVRAAIAIGLDRIVEMAEAAGMGSDLKPYPSIALGAQEVVPLDAAAAFACFANGGKRPRPFAVSAVVGEDGRPLEKGEPKLVRVFSPQAAYLTLDLMRGVVDRGTAGALRGHGFTGDVAGKTGTTNDKRDAWFVGFRPGLLALVWVGFDDTEETSMTGAQGALPIWEDFMAACGQAESDDTFARPAGITWASVDPATGGLATDGCPETLQEIFIENALPGECSEHHESPFKRFWRQIFSRHSPSPARKDDGPHFE